MTRSTVICRSAGRLRNGLTAANGSQRVERSSKESMAHQVRAMLGFHREGIPVLDYGNNLRQMAQDVGVEDAFDIPDSSRPMCVPCSAGV